MPPSPPTRCTLSHESPSAGRRVANSRCCPRQGERSLRATSSKSHGPLELPLREVQEEPHPAHGHAFSLRPTRSPWLNPLQQPAEVGQEEGERHRRPAGSSGCTLSFGAWMRRRAPRRRAAGSRRPAAARPARSPAGSSRPARSWSSRARRRSPSPGPSPHRPDRRCAPGRAAPARPAGSRRGPRTACGGAGAR